MNDQTITCYNVFTGSYFEILKSDAKHLTQGQLPLKKKPSPSCKKCFGRGYEGKSLTDFTYIPCLCLRKQIDLDIYKGILKNEDLAQLQSS